MSNNWRPWSEEMERFLAGFIIHATPWRTSLKISAKRIAAEMRAVFPDRQITRDAVLGKKKRYYNWKDRAPTQLELPGL